ncbi:MAG: trypsin-like peptidase domain-containing protein [Oscillospiraceae bacterium]|jgi:serine protease Do|nr:trypsin-like peptidase domain-containing protein [Oscillospiraceae bacterium]
MDEYNTLNDNAVSEIPQDATESFAPASPPPQVLEYITPPPPTLSAYAGAYQTLPYYTPAPPSRPPLPPQTAEHRATPPRKVKYKRKRSRKAFLAAVVLLAALVSSVFGVGGAYVYNNYLVPAPLGTQGGAVFYQGVPQGNAKTTQTAAGSSGLDVAAVAQTALDSVVVITTEALQGNGRFSQMVTTGAGSGVILSKDGHIVTNHHVVGGARKITVKLQNGKEYNATLVGSDEKSDIAVLKIDADALTPAVMGNSAGLVVGEPTVAIGNPLGELGGTVTEGIISALDRAVTIDNATMNLLQTSAAINPGNSGGGLFNAHGELIGIVNAKSSGTGIEGLGFAIPIDTAKLVIEDIIAHGYVTGRVANPFQLVEVSDMFSAMQYRVSEAGLYIAQSTDAQFQRGDRIVDVDGKSIDTQADFSSALSGKKPGEKIQITVQRDGEETKLTHTLVEETN